MPGRHRLDDACVVPCLRERVSGDGLLIETTDLAQRIAQALSDKLGEDIILLDMRDVVSYTDWFVIATGRNKRQTQAMADEVRVQVKAESALLPGRVEGQKEGDWILLDYFDVVVHIFTPESRAYYRLDQLWGQVPAIEFAS
jgi:ribosome-associated protein